MAELPSGARRSPHTYILPYFYNKSSLREQELTSFVPGAFNVPELSVQTQFAMILSCFCVIILPFLGAELHFVHKNLVGELLILGMSERIFIGITD